MNNSQRRRLCGLILPVALLAGCVNQKNEVALYRKELDKLPGATIPLVPDTSPLSLQQAMRLTEQNDEALSLTGETYLQALIAKQLAFAAFLPTISIGPAFTESQRLRGQIGPSHNFDIPANLNLNVFNGFHDYNALKAADSTIEQQRQLLLNEQQIVMLQVVQTYYAVLQSERSVTVLTNSLQVQEERVQLAISKKQLGSGTQLDIAQSQANASSTHVSLIQSQTDVVTGRATLSFLVGQDLTTRHLSDGFAPPGEVDDLLDVWLENGMKHRQDLIAAHFGVDAAYANVQAALGEYLPSVSVNVEDFLYKESDPIRQKLFGGITANIPVFEAGTIEANVRDAYSNWRIAKLTESQTAKQVTEDVRDAYANLDDSREQIRELKIELDAARDAVVQSQLSFDNGLATNLDVLTAQDTLLTTQLQLATQEYQQKIAYLNLLRVCGQLDIAISGQILSLRESTTRPSANTVETTTPNALQPTSQPALETPTTQPTATDNPTLIGGTSVTQPITTAPATDEGIPATTQSAP